VPLFKERLQNAQKTKLSGSSNAGIITLDINEFMKCLAIVYFVLESKITHSPISYLAFL
jgi:hypothetical protein